MNLEIYAVFDKAAKAYMTPFFTHNEGLAMRSFSDAVNNPDSPFFRHPNDFTLYKMGAFDDNLGLFEIDDPEKIATAIDVIIQPETTTELFDV